MQPRPLTPCQDSLSAPVLVSRLRPALRKGICLSRSLKPQKVVPPQALCSVVLSPVRVPFSNSPVQFLEIFMCFRSPFCKPGSCPREAPCQGPGPGDSQIPVPCCLPHGVHLLSRSPRTSDAPSFPVAELLGAMALSLFSSKSDSSKTFQQFGPLVAGIDLDVVSVKHLVGYRPPSQTSSTGTSLWEDWD